MKRVGMREVEKTIGTIRNGMEARKNNVIPTKFIDNGFLNRTSLRWRGIWGKVKIKSGCVDGTRCGVLVMLTNRRC